MIRSADLNVLDHLGKGLLVPALEDWEPLESPPVYALYPRRSRVPASVRAFVEFASELFAKLEMSLSRPAASEPMPQWFRNHWVGPVAHRTHGK